LLLSAGVILKRSVKLVLLGATAEVCHAPNRVERRHQLRPGMLTELTLEYSQVSGFERRKLSIGICARAFGTACIHEHACVRCSMLRPEPDQRGRLVEIRDNLVARITEAEREGWLGELEGLEVSLAGAQDKLAQLDAELARRSTTVDLGIPTFRDIAGRDGTSPRQSG
jgi:hypothetical protein